MPDHPMPAGRIVALPGVTLWVVDSGGDGVPVVLLHAATGTSENWSLQFAALCTAGYRVIAFDRRGWGRSVADAASGSQPGTAADDLEALVSYLELAPFHLVAVAAGGGYALDYAAWRPDRLRSLVVAASNGRMSEDDIAAFSERIAIPGLHDLSAIYREVGASYRGADPDGTARWLAIEREARQHDAPRQPLRTPNTRAKLRGITTPALVIAAGADLIAPPALMQLWSAALPKHTWALIADAGHSIAWEQPQAFNAQVLAFLRDH